MCTHLNTKPAEAAEGGGARPVQQLHPLPGELERRALEPEVAARAGAEQEAKVDVDEMPLRVEQNVAVVPVFDLRDGGERSRSQSRNGASEKHWPPEQLRAEATPPSAQKQHQQ